MATLTVIAAYDVREDDRRARLAALLQAYGDRVQKSVFVMMLEEEELEELRGHVGRIIDPKTDSFLVYRQCSPCWDKQLTVGQARTPSPVRYWAVF
ncbi:CRISPR-associated protein, Cas2 family [Tessaracoccus bendigoensis DSM 12906]|uniref:CRISPR-associated endoribonuclease Cas2 n=1 Tax=Tessaracoccus bendigoensis DSM 12906 TaxID=1123357 RepID=A0A1M6N440_9ACTN|nr:CRISPR-associated endonuclease Cas2 [Tessaracoccus bendigoensis]SHJ90447.1 CRISPR-associated protein, Cas2 family [Tessaracoccus bendigoensis DSM 12906]